MPFVPKVRPYYAGLDILTFYATGFDPKNLGEGYREGPLYSNNDAKIEGNPIYQNIDVTVTASGSHIANEGVAPTAFTITNTLSWTRSITFNRVQIHNGTTPSGDWFQCMQQYEISSISSGTGDQGSLADPKKQTPAFIGGRTESPVVIGTTQRTGYLPSGPTDVIGSISVDLPSWSLDPADDDTGDRLSLKRISLFNTGFVSPSTAAEWRDLRLLGTKSGTKYVTPGSPNDTRQYAWSWRIY